ncbi:hypothetical protein AXF42_Ash020296 [Apostasia shenzhenica]|uniref:CRIB domain-containing protein n=1 Tax=Apostasia shenzhenica TaxID=1088818 RepID=A0A2H9ZSZ4_9ASPA|nr:hypothetical protein AXF42_Ash020296 [Apostasia shenzhenica]
MAPKVKGLFKGFKYLTQIFGNAIPPPPSNSKLTLYKEDQKPELEIGYPTHVRHVAHIGWDGASSNAPKFEITRRQQSSPPHAKCTDSLRLEIPKQSKKTRQRKAKASSPVMSRSSSWASFATAPDESPNRLPTAYDELLDREMLISRVQPAVTESVFIEADISVTWKMHKL